MCKFSRQVVHGPHGEDLAPPVESIMVVMHIMRSPVGVKAPEEVALSAAARLQSLRASDGAWRVACTRAIRSHRLESHRGPSTTGGVARDTGSVRGQRTAAEQGTVSFLTPLTVFAGRSNRSNA